MPKDNLGGPKQVTTDQPGPNPPTEVVVSPPPPAKSTSDILKTHQNELRLPKNTDNFIKNEIPGAHNQ